MPKKTKGHVLAYTVKVSSTEALMFRGYSEDAFVNPYEKEENDISNAEEKDDKPNVEIDTKKPKIENPTKLYLFKQVGMRI